MNTKQKHLLEKFLDQELPATGEQYLAYRQKVKDGLGKVRHKERLMRIATQAAWAMTGLLLLLGGIVDFNRDRFPEQLRLWAIAVIAVSLACATALLAFYLLNYRPRLSKTEQDAVLVDLQQQLHELREQFPPGPKQP